MSDSTLYYYYNNGEEDEVELDDIKYAKDMGVIFQNIFKSPLIVKFYDKNGYYSYSYALKRISKVEDSLIEVMQAEERREKRNEEK